MSLDKWAEDFLKRRVEEERFLPTDHSFYVHSPLRQYVQLLFTGFIKPTFYAKASEIYAASRELHKTVVREDPDFHLASIRVARDEALMKDQPIIGVLTRLKPEYCLRDKSFNDHVTLLSTYPPHHLLRKFVEPVRRREFGYGLGRHVKRLLSRVLDTWVGDRLRYYIIRYRRAMRDLINLTHYPLPGGDYARVLFNRELDKVGDDYFRAYVKYLEFARRRRYVDAAELADECGLPFELMRTTIPLSSYADEPVYRALLNRATPLSLMSFALSLARAGVPTGEMAKYVVRKGGSKGVTSLDVAKPMLMALNTLGIGDPLTKALGEVYAKKMVEVWKRIDTSFLKVSDKKIALILDASGSMFWHGLTMRSYFIRSLAALAPLGVNVKHLILFSNYAEGEDPSMMCSLEGLFGLIHTAYDKHNRGTNIVGALSCAERLGDVDIVILSTDEQANINEGNDTEAEIIRRILSKNVGVIIHNPSPYPVHISNPIDGVTYIYGDRAESIIGSLRLQAMRDLKDEEVKELIMEIATVESGKGEK